MKKRDSYHPEPYWTEVAERIGRRTDQNVIAGDDEPYYRYKRRKAMEMLDNINFGGKSVLEVGSGPGGNLKRIWKQNPKRLAGADISAKMIELARENGLPEEIELYKIDGVNLPFKDDEFDIVITVTVLQHNTDEDMMKKIVSELCRVASEKVILMEEVDNKVKGDELCVGRPARYYGKICNKYGFKLLDIQYINIKASYLMAGAARKLLNRPGRKEGESPSKLSILAQKALLPITKKADFFFPSKSNLAKMIFVKI